MKIIPALILIAVLACSMPLVCASGPPDSTGHSGDWGGSFGYSAIFNRAVRTLTLPDLRSYPMDYGWMDGAMVSAGVFFRCRAFQPTLQVNYLINHLEGNTETFSGSGTWYTESSLDWHELGIELLAPACWKAGKKGSIFVGGGVGINIVLYQTEEVHTELLVDSLVTGHTLRNPPIPGVSWSVPVVAGYRFPLGPHTALSAHLRYAFTPAINTEAPFNRQTIAVGLTISHLFGRTYSPMDIRL